MMIRISVEYNQMGVNLLKKNSDVFDFDVKTKYDENGLKSLVNSVVPEALIKNFHQVNTNRKFDGLKVGDLVKITHVIVENKYSRSMHSDITKVTSINSGKINVYGYRQSFNFDGVENKPNKKYPSTIEIPTQEEIDAYNYGKEHISLAYKVESLIENEYHWNMPNDKLEEIINIIKASQN